MRNKCHACHGSGHAIDHAALGLKLRKLREKSGKFPKEVSMAMGISLSMLCRLEQGRRRWTEDLRQSFLDAVSDVVK